MDTQAIANKYGDGLYVVARILVGLMFSLHGAQKFGLLNDGTSVAGFSGAFGFPLWLGGLVALTELLVGICLVLGLFVRWAAVIGGIVMVCAVALAHSSALIPIASYKAGSGGEGALLYLAFFFVAMKIGNGRASLEQALFKKEH